MKLPLALLFAAFVFANISVIAQDVSPEMKRKINEVYTTLERYKATTPLWKQKVDAGMAAGNYFMSVQEWSKAINCFNTVLKIVPNYSEAIIKKKYCRNQLKLLRKR